MLRFIGPPEAPGRFALVRELGRGGMGVVYEAEDRATGARIALKTLAPGDTRFLSSLQREFRLMQRVRHPNLVRIHGLYQCADTWALAMELLEGHRYLTWVRGEGGEGGSSSPGSMSGSTLDSKAGSIAGSTLDSKAGSMSGSTLDSKTGFPTGSTLDSLPNLAPGSPTAPSLLAELTAPPGRLVIGPVLDRLQATLSQLGRALGALHAEGLVHCDVKPSNLLVTSEDRLVLFDFGLTQPIGDEPHPRAHAGTPAYMAPEQLAGTAVTAAADCYATGVMLYQALTGRLPFVGPLQDLLHHKRTWTPAAPRLLAPGVPPALERLCLRLLAPDPAARPTAAELATWTPAIADPVISPESSRDS